jgi:hypothetical protein
LIALFLLFQKNIQTAGSFTPMERFLCNIAKNEEFPILFDFIVKDGRIPSSVRIDKSLSIWSSNLSDLIMHCRSYNWLSIFLEKRSAWSSVFLGRISLSIGNFDLPVQIINRRFCAGS